MDPTMTGDLMNLELGDVLFEKAMKGRWVEVVDICTQNPWSLVAGITRLKDTLLHLAVSYGQVETVRNLTDIIMSSQPNPELLLGTKNERGNTALHIAALMGNEAMCDCIARVDPPILIGERNNEGETPLYTAVLFGQKQAFQCLYDLCPANERYSYSRKTRGDTILHRAISGDHLDLALRIIELYGKVLVNAVDEDGITPLHLLADKPSAFPSGSRLGFFQRIIYKCIYVDEHKVMEPDDHFFQRSMRPIDQRNPNNYPENYRTCNDFYRLFWNFFTFLRHAMGREVQPAKENPEIAMGLHVEVQTEENPEITMGLHHVEVQTAEENPESKGATNEAAWNRRFFPANYDVCCNFLKLANRIVLIVLGGGFPAIRKIYEEKQQHKLSIQIMDHLLEGASMSEFYHAGKTPSQPSDIAKYTVPARSKDDLQETDGIDPIKAINTNHDHSEADQNREEGEEGRKHEASRQQTNSSGGISRESVPDGKKIMTKSEPETAILIATKNGVKEIVEKILDLVPVAINDVNAENKNAVLLAVENRQPQIYKLLWERNIPNKLDSVFRVVDKKGNSAFHLAAKLDAAYKPWLIPGEALQMQWEMKWYEFVTTSIPSNFVHRYNNKGKTPEEVFITTHKNLVKKGGEWLTKTAQSYSVVAALIATVAFATSTTVPGGLKQDTGNPTLENKPAFHLFAISSLVALCFSVTALVMFLSILTSRTQERDFGKDLPRKLLIGLTSLFVSIAAVLTSFCSGHFFVVQNNDLKYVAFAVYAATCLPVTFFAAVQFPLYFDLIHATFTKVPRRSYKATL
ncbi:uncharacterized protein LOC108986245 isoform X3 [Juglans regia]|uniref:Uncharacterized protein LOC108986245 isoform X3 n=1 Tax=Juglans regia TaxID=51240 RepID=A0A6P9ELH3_JUGRE|nr:uncharacterized protein LOC108986245 isoform X3 [Juglans regia]